MKSTKATLTQTAKPLVSIVTPVHNGEAFIAETIQTVLAQTYDNWEWFIVDDNSSDQTLAIIEKAKQSFASDEATRDKINVIKLEQNGGAAKARNTGIKAAHGDYLCFLDADDLWKANKLERQLQFMSDTKAAFSFTGYEFADASGKPNGKVVSIPATITYKQALKNTTIWTSTVMFDMNQLTVDNILMPTIESEDTATWWTVLKRINYAYGLNNTLAFYRRSKHTLSSNKLKAIQRIWALYRKQENLNLVQSLINFIHYALNTIRRRV